MDFISKTVDESLESLEESKKKLDEIKKELEIEDLQDDLEEESETNYDMIIRKYFGFNHGFNYKISFQYVPLEEAYVLLIAEPCGKKVFEEKFSNVWNFLYWLGEEYNED